MAEWSKAAVLKTAEVQASVGSNPTLPAIIERKTLIDWKFVNNPPDQSTSDDDWHALEYGYLDPAEILADEEQIRKVVEAELLLTSFFQAVREAGIRQEM